MALYLRISLMDKRFYSTEMKHIATLDRYLPTILKHSIIYRLWWEPVWSSAPNAQEQLYRTLYNEREKFDILWVTWTKREWYQVMTKFWKNTYTLWLHAGMYETDSWIELSLQTNQWGGCSMKAWLYCNKDSLDIVALRSKADPIVFNKLQTTLWMYPYTCMFLLASILWFEKQKKQIRLIKQEYSEFAYHKQWANIPKKLALHLPLEHDQYRYYWKKDMFLDHLTSLSSTTLHHLVEFLNTLASIQPRHTPTTNFLYDTHEDLAIKWALMHALRTTKKQ